MRLNYVAVICVAVALGSGVGLVLRYFGPESICLERRK